MSKDKDNVFKECLVIREYHRGYVLISGYLINLCLNLWVHYTSKGTTTKASNVKTTVSKAKTNVATKSSKVSTASSKKVNILSKNNTKQTTYVKDAPKLYTSSGVAYSYGRPAESYIVQNKKTTNHSTTKSNSVSLPKATQAPVKTKTTKSSSDVVKIYQPTDSRSGAGKYSYAKKTSPTGAKEGASFVTSSLPIVGDAKDVQEAITGRDLVTGKKLSKTDRVITAAASVIPVVSGKSVNTVRKTAKSPTVKSAVKSGTKKLKQSTTEIIKKAKNGIQKIGKKVANDVKDVDNKVSSKVNDDVKIESGNSGEKVKRKDLDSLSTPSSKVLRQNMIHARGSVPDYPNAAHHIVAGNSPKAAEARAVLQKYGIDINDAANGIFLPTVKDVAEGAYHPSLHTNAYYDKINKVLSKATTKDDVLDILDFIGDELSSGTFMQ